MVQQPNPKIDGFGDRVGWAVQNLVPNPFYRRFISDINDVYFALEDAIMSGNFEVGRHERIPGKRTWETSLQTGSVPNVYLEWLYNLFPDLTPKWFETASFKSFLYQGKDVENHCEKWRSAIRYFSSNRSQLAEIAKNFYRNVDFSPNLSIDGLEYPLLTQNGWIRSQPNLLNESTELNSVSNPDPGRTFERHILSGLRGDYVGYKGGLAYATRRVVKPEPQHNGEIFCVKSVESDEHGFTGFRYYLARYFDYINTCEVLGAELADWALNNPDSAALPSLPFRGSPERAFDFTARASYPGVNCLSVFLNYSEARLPRGNYFLLHKRDETQLQAQNTVHVVPAGGHQGYAKGGWKEDTALWRTMMREFAEELFDQENLYQQPETWEDFLKYREVTDIKRVFFDPPNPAAKVFLHGFGLDPITLKPEIILTIIIDWAVVRSRIEKPRLRFNWELQKKRKKAGTRHQWVKLSRRELLRQAGGKVQTVGDAFLSTLPAGAACMIETARHYDYLELPD